MNNLSVLLIVLLTCFNQAIHAQNECTSCEKLKNNVVHITTTFDDGQEESGFGSVIAEVDNKLYIVTAKHVLYSLDNRGFLSINRSTKSVAIKFRSELGKPYPGILLNLPNNRYDIGLVEVQKPPNYIWSRDFYSKSIERGTKVWFIGRSGEWYIPTGSFAGSINKVSLDEEIFIDINSVQPGTSGAPLISTEGLVGLIFEDAADGAKAYAINKVMGLITKEWEYPWQMNLNPNLPNVPIDPSKEDKAWSAIINERNQNKKLEKLETYISNSDGSHLADARKMFEGLLYGNIKKAKNIEKYTRYFPKGEHIEKVESIAFSTDPGLYIKLFPQGRYVDEAKIKEENQLWTDVREGWDISIEQYLEKYPQGRYVDQVEELVWNKALAQGAEKSAFRNQGFEKYIKLFPSGKHVKEALKKIEGSKN